MELKEKLKQAIVATGSRSYWNEQLINDFIEKINFADAGKVMELLDDYIAIGKEFKVATILRDLGELQKKQIENSQEISENDKEFARTIILYTLQSYARSDDINKFFAGLEPVRQVLIEKGLWKNEGRWARWVAEREKAN